MTLDALRRRLCGQLPMPLTHVVPVEHAETAAVVRRRKRVVAGVSVAGAALLGASLSTKPGSKGFYATTLSVAGVWTAGGRMSGPRHLGWIESGELKYREHVVDGLDALPELFCAQLRGEIIGRPLARLAG